MIRFSSDSSVWISFAAILFIFRSDPIKSQPLYDKKQCVPQCWLKNNFKSSSCAMAPKKKVQKGDPWRLLNPF